MKVVKIFLLICGVLIVGGCSSGERGEEKDVSPITLSDEQYEVVQQFSGSWETESKVIMNIEITKETIKLEEIFPEGKERKTDLQIYKYETEGKIHRVYGVFENRVVYITEIDSKNIYIGGGLTDAQGESAWQVKAHKVN